jgi:putative oxidoreductase
MKRIFATRDQRTDIDLMLLLIRIICGYAFILVGWGKIQNPVGWMGENSGFPGIFQALAAISEFVGGIALVLGFLTRLAAFGLVCTMVVAVYMHKVVMGDPFVSLTGGSSYQLAVLYLLLVLLLLVAGPGRFSVDRLLFGVDARPVL